MADFDPSTGTLTAKLVYYGPALSGKTTNLVTLHDRLGGGTAGELMVFDTRDDRTLFFDRMPLRFRARGGLTVRLKVFTVSGARSPTTRPARRCSPGPTASPSWPTARPISRSTTSRASATWRRTPCGWASTSIGCPWSSSTTSATYLEQAGQVYVREKIGLDFATVLRSVLRQDPNVILLGEIRDLETGRVAFHAALTGHLVLSTLHTNSASATVVRLRDLGLDPTVITSALAGILAQRLVRRLCPACLDWADADPAVLSELDLAGKWEGKAPRAPGCPECQGSGYRGRVAIVEILEMNDALREAIRGGAGEREIQRINRASGAPTLLEDGLTKVKGAVTSLGELLRVLGPQVRQRVACPRCGIATDADHRVCPHCGRRLLCACAGCGRPLEPGWRHCPDCGGAAPEAA